MQVFYGSMLNILDQKAIAVIFANVEDILLTNTVRTRMTSLIGLLKTPRRLS